MYKADPFSEQVNTVMCLTSQLSSKALGFSVRRVELAVECGRVCQCVGGVRGVA